jgi:hypothetical protein
MLNQVVQYQIYLKKCKIRLKFATIGQIRYKVLFKIRTSIRGVFWHLKPSIIVYSDVVEILHLFLCNGNVFYKIGN